MLYCRRRESSNPAGDLIDPDQRLDVYLIAIGGTGMAPWAERVMPTPVATGPANTASTPSPSSAAQVPRARLVKKPFHSATLMAAIEDALTSDAPAAG